MQKKKTILITAYAVNPYKGSEDGTGWNISRELAKTFNVKVVTRKNNQPEIERYMAENEGENLNNMEFLYYDLPAPIMRLKHKLGERGYVLYFYFWQLFLPLFIKRKGLEFDLCHGVNFHSDSHPQFLWMLGKPVFWGPIGHHPPVPKAYILGIYDKKDWLKDRIYNGVKFLMRNLDPFYYVSKWSAKRIFVINSGVNKSVGANPEKVIILPAVASESFTKKALKQESETFTVLSVGRFVYMKGFDVVIRAFAKFYAALPKSEQAKVRLRLVGKGEELERMESLVEEEGIGASVEIIHWVDKSEMDEIYKTASVFCFGSHEGAGMVVPEALSYGLPVVCFDNYGPGELCTDKCAIKVPYGTYEQSVLDFATALRTLFHDKKSYKKKANEAMAYAGENFKWSRKVEVIKAAYSLID